MRASDLDGKEVINIASGERLGEIKKTELLVNLATGTVEGLVLFKKGWGGREVEIRTIPWQQIKKISDDLVLFAEESESVLYPG